MMVLLNNHLGAIGIAFQPSTPPSPTLGYWDERGRHGKLPKPANVQSYPLKPALPTPALLPASVPASLYMCQCVAHHLLSCTQPAQVFLFDSASPAPLLITIVTSNCGFRSPAEMIGDSCRANSMADRSTPRTIRGW